MELKVSRYITFYFFQCMGLQAPPPPRKNPAYATGQTGLTSRRPFSPRWRNGENYFLLVLKIQILKFFLFFDKISLSDPSSRFKMFCFSESLWICLLFLFLLRWGYCGKVNFFFSKMYNSDLHFELPNRKFRPDRIFFPLLNLDFACFWLNGKPTEIST